MGGILYAREVPPYGGDTLFANLYLAYETLSDGMKEMLGKMRAVHAANPDLYVGDPNVKMTRQQIDALSYVHPVVRTHPESGRKLLFLHPHIVKRFDGMTEAESAPLLEYLFRHLTRPEFTCRFRWRPGSIAFWDNRCAQHNAINDYGGYRRLLHRVTLAGDTPKGP